MNHLGCPGLPRFPNQLKNHEGAYYLRQSPGLTQVKIVPGNCSRIASAKAVRALAANLVSRGGEIGFKPELQVGVLQ